MKVTSLQKEYDVIVVGCGAAGLYTALNLPSSLQVLVLAKRKLTLSNSSLAQGGIAAVVPPAENDSIELHMNDSLIAGGFKNNPESLRLLLTEGPKDVLRLMDYQVDFDKGPDGRYDLTLEGGHSRHRILHHKDCTGREVVEKLIAAAQQRENITLLPDATVCDLQRGVNCFSLDVLIDGEQQMVTGRYCVLATGGIGRVYEYTTNSDIATGDGITLAYRLGAKIKNLHLVQFHPTAFANKARECFLISESVRGEGAYLLNGKRERFMHRYDDRLELAPRDVVSHSIIEEARRLGDNRFFLDITHKDPEFVKARFPMIDSRLREEGIDMTRQLIPVYPCQHYLMGGIDVNLHGESSIPNLFAAGECAHTGVHGSNRLASNSLLEAIVFGRQIAEEIGRRSQTAVEPMQPCTFSAHTGKTPLPEGIRTEVRAIMQHCHFVIPNPTAAVEGFQRVSMLKEQLEQEDWLMDVHFVEARSLVTVAYIILKEVL